MSTPLVTRAQAGLVPPRVAAARITSEGQTAHYGGDSPWGAGADRSSAARFVATTDHARCATIWRAWQSFHMRPVSQGGRGWNDIAYNSGVCPHGYRFEGRGPGRRSGANGTTTGNNRSTATCYIAGGNDPLTDPAKRAFADEFARMSRARWVHSDWKSTSCPGEHIRAWKAQGWRPPALPAPAPTPPQEDDDMAKPMLVYIGPKTRHVCQVDGARHGVHWIQGASAVRGAKHQAKADDPGNAKAGAVCRLDPGSTDPNIAAWAIFVLGLPFYGPMPPGHAELRAKYKIAGPLLP